MCRGRTRPLEVKIYDLEEVDKELLKRALTHIHSVYGRLYEEPIHVLAVETRDLGT